MTTDPWSFLWIQEGINPVRFGPEVVDTQRETSIKIEGKSEATLFCAPEINQRALELLHLNTSPNHLHSSAPMTLSASRRDLFSVKFFWLSVPASALFRLYWRHLRPMPGIGITVWSWR